MKSKYGLTLDFGIVAIASVVIAAIIGLNDFYDRSADNLYARKHDCVISLQDTYNLLLRRAHQAKIATGGNEVAEQEHAVDSDIELNEKWAAIQTGCLLPGLFRQGNRVMDALASAKNDSTIPLAQTPPNSTENITRAANWTRFAIAEVYRIKLTTGWIFTCNIAWCLHSYPNNGYSYGDEYKA